MIRYEDECVGCSSLGLPCLGSSCSNRNVLRCYCDDCGEDIDPSELYDVDGAMLCDECALKRIKAPVDNWRD